ncbi:MAG: LacI family DNA-binding transcriptional regulator [Acidimicrobiales bacterium]|jgi:LacI family transcriptional regulator
MTEAPVRARRAVPTMRDVAALAGVSTMTVSRTLHDDPRITDDTKSRVRAALNQLGYVRNDTARNLRMGRGAGAVGLVIGNLANPFYSQLALGIGEAVEQYGLTVMLVNAGGDPHREARLVNDLLSRRVEGIVIAPEGDDHRHLGPGPMHGTPVVFVARPPSGIAVDCVLVDDFAGTKEATGRLIARGHTNIAFVGLPPTVWAGAERLRGFKAAMAEARLHTDKRYVRYQQSDVVAAEKTVRSLLSMAKPPTALFAANNRTMIGALRAAGDSGAPIALAGFDDFELADMLGLPLIVVSYDAVDLGRRAAQLLLDRVSADGAKLAARRVTVPTWVVEYGPPGGKYLPFGRGGAPTASGA